MRVFVPFSPRRPTFNLKTVRAMFFCGNSPIWTFLRALRVFPFISFHQLLHAHIFTLIHCYQKDVQGPYFGGVWSEKYFALFFHRKAVSWHSSLTANSLEKDAFFQKLPVPQLVNNVRAFCGIKDSFIVFSFLYHAIVLDIQITKPTFCTNVLF